MVRLAPIIVNLWFILVLSVWQLKFKFLSARHWKFVRCLNSKRRICLPAFSYFQFEEYYELFINPHKNLWHRYFIIFLKRLHQAKTPSPSAPAPPALISPTFESDNEWKCQIHIGAIHTSELDRSEIDLSPKRECECERECERSNANWDRSKIDLNECEHFLKANWNRSQIDPTC